MNIAVPPPTHRARVIVVGNEKGGSGKSTTAMHLIASLLRAGLRVGSIDLDARQATLTRYIENRAAFMDRQGISLAMPTHRPILPSDLDDAGAARADEAARLDGAVAELSRDNDYLVIDTPGSDSFLSRRGHSFADTLVTPLNDSFVDFDMLATVDPETHKVLRPSHYSVMVWDQRKARAQRDRGSIDWIVMRNRIGSLESRNQRAVERVLAALSKRIGFRLAPGFSERVIFREMFLKGLTLVDLRDRGTGTRLNMSHLAARQEIRQLLEAIGLPQEPDGRAAPIAASAELFDAGHAGPDTG